MAQAKVVLGSTQGDCRSFHFPLFLPCLIKSKFICYGLSCLYAEAVECMSSAGSVWYVGVLCCEILLLMDMADMAPWKTME